jgi:tetratricopeptide (TPR) repeat protein
MASDVRILRVVVASPGDVQAERDRVPVVVDELNRGVAADRGLRLEVYRWETDACPGFHAEGPQGLIDPILRIEDSDIFVGIFWKRFGTPTADGQTGTEHEIGLAHEAWTKSKRPQIMVYFNQEPYAPQSRQETDQWGRVLDFKEKFPGEGLWWPYSGAADFEKLLRIHLTNFIRASFPSKQAKQAEPAATGEHLHQATPAALALHQLPPPPRDFTGREAELKELMAAVETAGVTISGLQGLGGVGKTALALALAEMLKPRYPDGQFYLDLKGVANEAGRKDGKAEPLTPSAAMAHVVRSYHPTAKLPESEAELSGLYRSVLDGQRALLVMDNARDRQQVEPLIPPSSCLLLVTSRQHFTLPGLYTKNLETLAPAEAEALLLKIAPRINGHAGPLAKLCEYLPMALRLAASAVAERIDLAPADYIKRLSGAQKRLELVDASLCLSYELLAPEMQKRFSALAVFPSTFDATAVAAVWAVDLDAAHDALSQLVAYSMLQWDGSMARYRLHDLVRLFADARLGPVERDAAQKRHAEHFETVLREADELYRAGKGGVAQGLKLFDLEVENIKAGQAWASEHAEKDPAATRLCSGYPEAGAWLLLRRQHPRELILWREAGLAAARRLKDRGAEGRHLGTLGIAYRNLGETRRAIEYYEQELSIAQEIGDRGGEGSALRGLGQSYADLGETGRAIDFHEQALKIDREIGDRLRESADLGNLGSAYYYLGETRRAIEYYEQYLAIAREAGDRYGEGNALWGFGVAYAALGETRRAVGYHEQHLAIAREMGDRSGQGNALWCMGLALDKLGDRARAIAHAEAALKIYEQMEDPKAEKVRKQLTAWKS